MTDTLGARLVAFRKSLVMTQDTFSAHTGVPLSTLKRYELSGSAPSTDALAAFAKAGVNLNWLVTGVGTMGVVEPPARPAPAKINVDALIKAFEVMTLTARPGETPVQTARKAVNFYMHLLETNMITPDGVGEGNLSDAA